MFEAFARSDNSKFLELSSYMESRADLESSKSKENNKDKYAGLSIFWVEGKCRSVEYL